MKISELIDPRFVNLSLQAASKEEAIEQIAQVAKGHPNLLDFPAFCRAIYERETVASTSIGNGVAIPHARTDQVKDLLLVVGRLNQPVKFAPTDEVPVRLLFLIGTQKKLVTEYLRVVGMLARHLRNEEFRRKLLEAPDAAAVIQTFVESEKEFT